MQGEAMGKKEDSGGRGGEEFNAENTKITQRCREEWEEDWVWVPRLDAEQRSRVGERKGIQRPDCAEDGESGHPASSAPACFQSDQDLHKLCMNRAPGLYL